MAGHLLFNSGSNESSLAPQFKWLDNTFNSLVQASENFDGFAFFVMESRAMEVLILCLLYYIPKLVKRFP
jgi:hypothetical protein